MSDTLPVQPVCPYCEKPKPTEDSLCTTPGCPGSILAQTPKPTNG